MDPREFEEGPQGRTWGGQGTGVHMAKGSWGETQSSIYLPTFAELFQNFSHQCVKMVSTGVYVPGSEIARL